MRPFAYSAPASIAEAAERLASPGARAMGGGTDLLPQLQRGIRPADEVVDLRGAVPAGILAAGQGMRIGASTRVADVARDPDVIARFAVLAEAAGAVASPQLREMGTVAGNLCQAVRCWYYRHPDLTCWLRGGDTCYAREGENQHHALFQPSPCVAAHPSDPATALLALDATVSVRGSGGERMVPIGEFFAPPDAERRRETTLGQGEIVTTIRLPGFAPDERSTYRKAMDRKVWAFALVGVAARVVMEAGRVADARLVLGGVAPVPWRVPDAEAVLTGSALEPDVIERAAEAALAEAIPLAKNGYKIPLATALVRRALSDLAAV